MRRLPAVAVLLFAGAALAGGGGTAASLLGQTPGLPANAQAAFAEWVLQDGTLRDGPRYAAFTQSLKQAALSPLPGQSGNAQSLAAQYATPEGQKKLAAMSLDQKIALAHQMSGQPSGAAMASGPVSQSDIARIKDVQLYPQTGDVRKHLSTINGKMVDLEKKWDADSKKIDDEQNAAYRKLPLCPSEAGEPSGIALRDLYRTYQDKRIALATNYLPKFQPLLTELKAAVAPEIAHGDRAVASWSAISNPGQKSALHGIAQGARNAAIGDAGQPFGLVEQVSKKAATTIADRKQIDITYAHAAGC